MLDEMLLQVEGCLARGTLVVFLNVGLLVPSKMKGPAESLATFVTFVGLGTYGGFLTFNGSYTMTGRTVMTLTVTEVFSSVSFLMPLEVHVLTKSSPTFLTHTGLVSRMSHRTNTQVGALAEASLILLAHRGLLLRVNDPVLDEVVAPAEAFPAFTTFIQSLLSLPRILLALV